MVFHFLAESIGQSREAAKAHADVQIHTLGMAQSLVVLFYVCARFGFDLAGLPGAIAPIALFLAIEAYLFYATRYPARRRRSGTSN
jgi:hypothetical protein